MNSRDDENYYRGLLESAQKGIENAKAFLRRLKLPTLLSRMWPFGAWPNPRGSTSKQLEHEADELWDHFKRVLRGD